MSDGVRPLAIDVSGLGFAYPRALAGGEAAPVLRDLAWQVDEGAFALLTGPTGSGKTTLLRLLKPEVAPAGELAGSVIVAGRDVRGLSAGESAHAVGFVFQSPDNQIVCDTVWHELAFGLENLGVPEAEMRLRVAETCQFLGIEPWFRARTHDLSGGQRQMLALASVLAMRPRLLLLDEPTSQLDPLAERDFLALLFRINRELGVTVVVATHRPGPMVPYATCAYRLEGGALHEVAPAALAAGEVAAPGLRPPVPAEDAARALALDDVWFRYARDAAWVLRGCDLAVREGEVRALLGGNGSGKSTLLALAAGSERPRRGRVARPLSGSQALLPQAPRALLACETVGEELAEWSRGAGYGAGEVDAALARLGLADARDRHPYDLSQGQQQLLALEKLLLTRPRLLLLDEPTKGLDDEVRGHALARVAQVAAEGASVVVATHDVGLVRDLCHTVSLLFDGQVALTAGVDEFLARSWVYGGTR